MALVYNGYKRSLFIYIFLDGNLVKSYNGQEAFTSLDGIWYSALTNDQFKVLSNTVYNKRLKDLQDYVEALEQGVNFTYDVIPGYEATIYSSICDPNTTTTTTTTTTSTTTTTTSTTTTSTTSTTTSTSTTSTTSTTTTTSTTSTTTTTSTTSSSTTTSTTTEVGSGYHYNVNTIVCDCINSPGVGSITNIEPLTIGKWYYYPEGAVKVQIINYTGLQPPLTSYILDSSQKNSCAEVSCTTSTTTTTTTSTTTTTTTTSTTSTSTTTTTTTEYIPPIVEEYGYEYNSYVLSNIAATGWHVPTQAEIDTLLTYVGGASIAGGKLKEIGIVHWVTPNTDATNEFGFTSLPASFRSHIDGSWQGYGVQLNIWTQSSIASLGSYNNDDAWSSGAFLARAGISIRLIKDDDIDPGSYIGNNGYVYPTVKIGNQVWIGKNLLETKLNNGTSIPEEQNNALWAGLSTGARCYYVI